MIHARDRAIFRRCRDHVWQQPLIVGGNTRESDDEQMPLPFRLQAQFRAVPIEDERIEWPQARDAVREDFDAAAGKIPLLEGRNTLTTEPTAFVCSGYVCQQPSRTSDELLQQLPQPRFTGTSSTV